MSTVLLGLVVGFGAVRLLLLAAPDLYRSPVLARTNYRGRAVATGAGLLVVLAVVLVEGTRVGLGALGVGDQPGFDGTRPLVLLTCLGFGLLGLLDDLLATGEERGFRGHLRARTGPGDDRIREARRRRRVRVGARRGSWS